MTHRLVVAGLANDPNRRVIRRWRVFVVDRGAA